MNRYFFIAYSHANGFGNCSHTTDCGFVNHSDIKNLIEKEFKATNCIITNIIELSEADFKDLWRK